MLSPCYILNWYFDLQDNIDILRIVKILWYMHSYLVYLLVFLVYEDSKNIYLSNKIVKARRRDVHAVNTNSTVQVQNQRDKQKALLRNPNQNQRKI